MHIGQNNIVINCLSLKQLCIFHSLTLLFRGIDGFTFLIWALSGSEETGVGEGVAMPGVDWRMTLVSSFISPWISCEARVIACHGVR